MHSQCSMLGLLLHAMLLLHIMAFSCQVVRTEVKSDKQVTEAWVGSQKTHQNS